MAMKRIKEYRTRDIERVRTRSQKIAFTMIAVIFFLYAATFIYTLGWAFITSLKEKLGFIRDPFAWPSKLHFENYIEAFKVLRIGESTLFDLIFNSAWYSVLSTVMIVFFTNVTAYCVSKYKFVGNRLLYFISLFVMIVPVVGALPQQYILYSNLGMIDSPLYLILFTGGFGFNFFLFYGFYKNISWDYAEAVFVDGGGHFTVYFKVMLPQSLSMCFALGIIQFITQYNDYNTMILFLPSYPTLASGLYQFQFVPEIRSNYPVYYAVIIITTIPVIVLYACFQEQIMNSTVAGGLKG